MRYGAPAAHSLDPAEQEFKLHNKITEKFLPFAWRGYTLWDREEAHAFSASLAARGPHMSSGKITGWSD